MGLYFFILHFIFSFTVSNQSFQWIRELLMNSLVIIQDYIFVQIQVKQ